MNIVKAMKTVNQWMKSALLRPTLREPVYRVATAHGWRRCMAMRVSVCHAAEAVYTAHPPRGTSNLWYAWLLAGRPSRYALVLGARNRYRTAGREAMLIVLEP